MQILHFLSTPNNKVRPFVIHILLLEFPSHRLTNHFRIFPKLQFFFDYNDSLSVIANASLQEKERLNTALVELVSCFVYNHYFQSKEAVIEFGGIHPFSLTCEFQNLKSSTTF
jgi:hypothetical protein